MITKQHTILHQEIGSNDLSDPRILKIEFHDISGFVIGWEYYLIQNVDFEPMDRVLVAKGFKGFNFVPDEDGLFESNETVDFLSMLEIDPQGKMIKSEIPAAIFNEFKSFKLTFVEIARIKHKARMDQILVMLQTATGTPFEPFIKQIVDWYNESIQKFINFGFDNIISDLENETDPDRLSVLNTIPVPELGLTAKQAMLNRFNAYFDFIATE